MKKIYSILLCIGLIAGFISCEKDRDFKLITLTLTSETITPSYESAEVRCVLKAAATISEVYVHYSPTSSFADYKEVEMTNENGTYIAQLTDLHKNTMYYVRYGASNKYSSTITKKNSSFHTLDFSLPVLTTTSVTQVTTNSAVTGGNVTDDGGASVTERGVVYGTSPNPTTSDNKITNGIGTGAFTCNLTGLQANTTYYVRAYATNSQGTAYGDEMSFTTKSPSSSDHTGTENGHEYVDLGLSVKWATFNVGANKPEDYGDYFAWGETEPKTTYDWSTYKWCNGSYDTQTKYCIDSSYGTVDNKTVLDKEDDAAHVNWGGNWRMPTRTEQDELREQCTWTWTTQNGVKGYNVTSKKNGNSIFLPAAGYRSDSSLSTDGAGSYGDYWSGSLSTDGAGFAYYLGFSSSYVGWGYYYRYGGHSVRPVCP